MQKWTDLSDNHKKALMMVIGTVGVTVAVGLSVVTRTAVEKVTPVVMPADVTPRPSEAAQRVVAQHLTWAETQAAAGLEPQLAAVKEFFHTARQRTRAYGTVVLGWDSKWKLASDYVSGGNDHAAFLRESFEETLFSQDELDQLVAQTVSAYLRHVDDIESQMLVNMAADLEQLPAASLPQVVDADALHATLAGAMEQAATAAKAEFQAAVGREIVSWIASEVLTCVGVQLATSAGIVGTGAAAGWSTFGVTVVLGLMVDAIITEIYDATVDPVGQLSNVLNAQLDFMETLILRGTEDSPGLNSRLQDYSTRRNAARRQAIQRAVLAPSEF